MKSNHIPKSVLAYTGAIFALAIIASGALLLQPFGVSAKTSAELRSEIDQKRQREGLLTDDIERMGSRVRGLQGRVDVLQRSQSAVESDLAGKVQRQQQVADELNASRARLARLRKRLAKAKSVLSARIVAVYKNGAPDILTVVLKSEGFAEMVERATYLKQIADQDQRVIEAVKRLKGESKRETVRLAGLEREVTILVAQVRQRRNEIASAKGQVAGQKERLATAAADRKQTLAGISRSRRSLESDLAAIERSSNQVAGILSAPPSGPAPKGSGRFVNPMSGTFTSPFGQRWGRLHAGIDIAAPEGTGIRAADSGTVRQAGWMGGYGNYTCIQHTASLSSCYAHQSSIGVSVGQAVRKGQAIGRSGNTGNSTGPHLHFEARVGGQPVDPMGYL